MKRQQGFTLIEISITMVVLFMVLPLAFLVMERVYAQSSRIAALNALKQSSAEICARLHGDLARNANVTVEKSNHGLFIRAMGGNIEYRFEKGRVLRIQGGTTVSLGSSPVEDATFIRHGDELTINLEVSSLNSVTRRIESLKTMESIPLKRNEEQ